MIRTFFFPPPFPSISGHLKCVICVQSCRSRNVAPLHLHADVFTEVVAADSRAPSYLRCKGARDKNADSLCSSGVIKRTGLSMIPRDLNGNKVEKMLSGVEFKNQAAPSSASMTFKYHIITKLDLFSFFFVL